MEFEPRTDKKEIAIVLNIVNIFCKLIHNSNTECLICMDNPDPNWHQYELSCGHRFHTRCFREWMRFTGKVKCSYCNESTTLIPYCNICNKYVSHQHF